ncbi:ferritin family protein [Telmatospirillum sp.]|uniref:ferritin family protein n=1 Tax=Telmatospirillum sp. TaxID=2079197 RepID=UPI002848FD1D|nr:ferritin family protein [Telmatospirillum sp.]MDR3439370.1 ferritin family protein [Telmatospirillum sp.]
MALPINPAFPLEAPCSVEELMEIAVGMEHEAALRYTQLASRMANVGETDLAATFLRLAAIEERHEQWLTSASRGRSPPRRFSWLLPETFDEADVAGAPLSAYRILAIAVRNEERAFAFYTYLAAMTETDPVVRGRAEALAREELNHVAQLRQLRRRAYHDQQDMAVNSPPRIRDLAELRRLAWSFENRAAVLCRRLSSRLIEQGDHVGATLVGAAGDEAAVRANGLVSGLSHEEDVSADRTAEMPPLADTATLYVLCEREAREVLDSYLSTAETAGEEALLVAAQELAEGALARLSLIRALQVHTGER